MDQGKKGLKGLKEAINAADMIGENLQNVINGGGPILGEGLRNGINAGLEAVAPSLLDFFSKLFKDGTGGTDGTDGTGGTDRTGGTGGTDATGGTAPSGGNLTETPKKTPKKTLNKTPRDEENPMM